MRLDIKIETGNAAYTDETGDLVIAARIKEVSQLIADGVTHGVIRESVNTAEIIGGWYLWTREDDSDVIHISYVKSSGVGTNYHMTLSGDQIGSVSVWDDGSNPDVWDANGAKMETNDLSRRMRCLALNYDANSSEESRHE